MKRILFTMVATLVVVLFSICDARGQIRYTSNGKMTIGNTDPLLFIITQWQVQVCISNFLGVIITSSKSM